MSVFHFIGLFNFVSKQKTMKVFKFGGASVKDANAVRNVSTILSRFSGEKLIVVVSDCGG